MMFRRLQTKLSVLYGAMFGLMLALLAAASYVAITGNVREAARGELQADGAVFDRLWQLKSQQLQGSADLLARDYGFRAAVATRDAATTQSALDNLRLRLGLEKAFIVGLDGSIQGLDGRQLDDGADKLWQALSDSDDASGALMIGGRPLSVKAGMTLAKVLAIVGAFRKTDHGDAGRADGLLQPDLSSMASRSSSRDAKAAGVDGLHRRRFAARARFPKSCEPPGERRGPLTSSASRHRRPTPSACLQVLKNTPAAFSITSSVAGVTGTRVRQRRSDVGAAAVTRLTRTHRSARRGRLRHHARREQARRRSPRSPMPSVVGTAPVERDRIASLDRDEQGDAQSASSPTVLRRRPLPTRARAAHNGAQLP